MKTPFILAAVGLMIVGSAFAQDQDSAPPSGPPPAGGRFMQACGADVQALCPTAQTGKDRHMCLAQNSDKVSPACNAFLATRRHHHMEPGQSAPEGTPPSDAPNGPPPGQGQSTPPPG